METQNCYNCINLIKIKSSYSCISYKLKNRPNKKIEEGETTSFPFKNTQCMYYLYKDMCQYCAENQYKKDDIVKCFNCGTIHCYNCADWRKYCADAECGQELIFVKKYISKII